MSTDIDVTVYIDQELGLSIVKRVRHGSTVGELKEELARDDPTGQAHAHDFILAAAGPGRAATLGDDTRITEELAELVVRAPGGEGDEAEDDSAGAAPGAGAAAGAPEEYRVLQGPLFKKPGADPASAKVIRLTRRVGSTVMATGRLWEGPSGGQWVELDPSCEKCGWLLVEGPGFDQPGPLLERVVPGEEPPILLSLFSMAANSTLCEACVRPSQTIRQVKSWIALRSAEDLQPQRILCAKDKPKELDGSSVFLKDFPAKNLLHDGVKVCDAGFKDGDSLLFMYMGEDGALS